MTAQDIYDRQGEIGGEAVHYILQELTGDPSPAGRTPIDVEALRQLAADLGSLQAQHGTQAPTAEAIEMLLR